MSYFKWLSAATALAAAGMAVPASASVTIASFTAPATADIYQLNPQIAGQSFTVTGTGPFDNVTFSFVAPHADATITPTAAATLAIYTSARPDTTAAAMMTDTTDLVARSTGVVDGAYVFDPSVTLNGGSQYFAYAYGFDQMTDPFHAAYSHNTSTNYYGGGVFYDATGVGAYSYTAFDANFIVNADDPVTDPVPEPGSWMLMITGFGLVAGGLRRRSVRTAAIA